MACKHLPGLEEENRVMKQLQALSGGDLGNSYTAKATGEKITAGILEEVTSMLRNRLHELFNFSKMSILGEQKCQYRRHIHVVKCCYGHDSEWNLRQPVWVDMKLVTISLSSDFGFKSATR